MNVREARQALVEIGLTSRESALFVHLVLQGASTAAELARASGIHRVQTYRLLDQLQARGLVEVTLERPRRFAAVAIREVFDRLAEEKRRELDALEAMREGMLKAWRRLAGRKRTETLAKIQILRGRPQIYRLLRRLVDEAREEVLAFTTSKGLQRSYRGGINQALVAAMERGVRARLLADLQPANAALLARVAERVPLRHLESQRGRFTVVDRSSVLAFLVQDEATIRGEGEVAMWTNSPDFVKAQVQLFEQAWASGVPAEERLAALGRESPSSLENR